MPLRALAPIALALVLCGCGSRQAQDARPPAPITVDGLRLPARVHGTAIEAVSGGRFQPRFWAGVNLGSTTPGHQPGEVAATRADYDRWLAGMGDLGIGVVRVYTILRPAFYDAVLAYDLGHPGRPIRVIQGVWIPEQEFLRTRDAYSRPVSDGFRSELRDAVAVVHGDADLPARPGHADGRYRSDVSPWLLAWSLGIEWDPAATRASDRANAGRRPFRGRYFRSSDDATPMESWLAAMLDYTAGLEAARGWSRPMTFTNWLSTDPLHHRYEPLATEDMVSIDAMHVAATAAWPGGFFASYHAYPYYPDFLRLTPAYGRGGDAYAGLLAALRAHHRGQAVMISEFGVPTGIGVAHRGPNGRDQGGHSEREAGRMDAAMLRDIRRQGFAGGIMFEWIDEWFKLTWNTFDTEQPADRRQLWRNALTNEEQFGLIAADPAGPPPGGGRIIEAGDGSLRELRAAKDEEYLYLRLRFDRPAPWRAGAVAIGFDVRPGGNRGLPGMPGVDPAADVALTVAGDGSVRVAQAAANDPIAAMYGRRHFVPVRTAALRPGSGVWDGVRLMLNRPYTVPVTGADHPTELADVSLLRRGDWREPTNLVRGNGDLLELRIPWAYLTYSDPSSNRVWAARRDGTIGSAASGRLGIDVVTGDAITATDGFAWQPWNTVSWHERRKAGWDAVRAAVAEVSRP